VHQVLSRSEPIDEDEHRMSANRSALRSRGVTTLATATRALLASFAILLTAVSCCWGGEVRGEVGAGPIRVTRYDGFGGDAAWLRRAVALANEQIGDARLAARLTAFGAGSIDHIADRGALRADDGAAILARLRTPREVTIECYTPWWPWDTTDADAVIGGRSIRLNGRMVHGDSDDDSMLPYWAGTIAHEFSHSIGYEHASSTATRSVPYIVGRLVCEQSLPDTRHRCPGRPVSAGSR
jgi:hypothetical protein